MVGGYCHTPIEKNRVDKHDKGFIFSLIPEIVKYSPKKIPGKENPLVTYDDFFLIFGNSELRIKS